MSRASKLRAARLRDVVDIAEATLPGIGPLRCVHAGRERDADVALSRLGLPAE